MTEHRRSHPLRLALGAVAALTAAAVLGSMAHLALALWRGPDAPHGTSPFPLALAADVGLLLAFCLQHSLMARRWFKDAVTRLAGPALVSPIYGGASAIALGGVLGLWQDLPLELFALSGSPAAMMRVLQVLGWAAIVVGSMEVQGRDLLGVRELVRLVLDGARPPAGRPRLVTAGLHGLVRHPTYAGLLLVLWATPVMTAGRFVLAAVWTLYLFVGIKLEERDLAAAFGDDHRRYRVAVPMVIPRAPTLAKQSMPAVLIALGLGFGLLLIGLSLTAG